MKIKTRKSPVVTRFHHSLSPRDRRQALVDDVAAYAFNQNEQMLRKMGRDPMLRLELPAAIEAMTEHYSRQLENLESPETQDPESRLDSYGVIEEES